MHKFIKFVFKKNKLSIDKHHNHHIITGYVPEGLSKKIGSQ